jgi:hypothetical protein
MAAKSHLQTVKAILKEVEELQEPNDDPSNEELRDWVGQICEAYIDLSERLEDQRIHHKQTSLLDKPGREADPVTTIFKKE